MAVIMWMLLVMFGVFVFRQFKRLCGAAHPRPIESEWDAVLACDGKRADQAEESPAQWRDDDAVARWEQEKIMREHAKQGSGRLDSVCPQCYAQRCRRVNAQRLTAFSLQPKQPE